MSTNLSSGRGRRVLHAFLGFVAGFGARTLLQIVQVPLFLHVWSPERYGEWLLLFTLPVSLALTDLGIGSAAGIALAERVSAGDLGAARSISTALRVVMTSLNLVLAAILIGLAVAGVPQSFGFREIVGADLLVAFLALGAYVIVGLQMECGFTVLRGIGRYPDQVTWGAALTLSELAAIVIGLYCFGSPGAIACAMLLTRLVAWAALSLHVRRQATNLRGIEWAGLLPRIKALAGPALGFAIFPLLNVIKIQGATIVIGLLFGPVTLAAFNAMRIISRLLDAAAGPANFLMSESSYISGDGRLAGIRHLHRRFMRPFLLFMTAGAFALLLLSGPLFRVWTGGSLPYDPFVLALLLVGSVMRVAAGVGLNIAAALARHTGPALLNMVASAAVMLLGYVVGLWTGDYYLVLAIFALAELVYLVSFYRRAFTASGDRTRAFLVDVMSWSAVADDVRFVVDKLRTRRR